MSDSRLALVTGGAGFIGSHLVDALVEAGWRVRVLDDLSTGDRRHVSSSAEFVEGSILSDARCREACSGADTVFHLAAKVTIRHSLETYCEDAETNLVGTLKLFRAAAAGGVRRFVFASSMGVYGDCAEGTPVDEDHAQVPLSPYGVSKLAAERDLLLLGSRAGVEPVILRLFNTYGTRQGYTPYVGVLTIFITRLLAGQACTIFGDGEQRRDFIHVADVARAFRLAADAPGAPGGIFNVGTGRGTSINELSALLEGRFPGAKFVHAPTDESEIRNSIADIGRARATLGFGDCRALADTIHEVIEYIRANPIRQ